MLIYFLKKNQFFFYCFLLIVIFQLGLISSVDMYIPNINCKMVLLNGQIIYIINDKNDNKIYKYNEANPLGYYQLNLKNKNIIKINEDTIIIFGGNNDNYYCASFKISSTQANISSYQSIKFSLNNVLKYNIACSSEEKCIVSFIDNNGFHIYSIDINSKIYNSMAIPSILGKIPLYEFNNIVCDSFDGDNFFCIFSHRKSENEWMNYYINGKFTDKIYEQNFNQLCDGICFSGNIIKDELNKKFLVCYEKSDTKLYIFCKYYSIDKKSILIEDEYEVGELTSESIVEKPLILNIYENTIFIEVDYKVVKEIFSMLLIISLDLRINIPSLIGKDLNLINILNDDDYYYLILEEVARTTIKKEEFISCNNNKIIYFSNRDEKEIDFSAGHVGEKIIFSLDKSVKLEKDEELISSFKNNFISLSGTEKFIFFKIEETNTLTNYYSYATPTPTNSKYFDNFSLICQIKIKLCFKRCKECNITKVSTDTQQYCYECNEGNGLASSVTNHEGYNCYLQSELPNYYFYNNLFYPCDETCNSCSNSNSCSECKNGYYFKSDGSSIKYEEKCFNKVPDGYFLDTNLWLYKPCYETCSSCSNYGTQLSNSCISCKNGYVNNYYFDKHQCTKDYKSCDYWEFKNNNIICLTLENCKDKSIVIEGLNKGQCVDSCEDYTHPFQNNQISQLYTFQCEKQKYCLTYYTCINHNFIIDVENQKCIIDEICSGEINIYDDDPFKDIEIIIPSNTTIITPEERKNLINKRIKIIKMFSDEEKDYNEVIKRFDFSLIRKYNDVLKTELSNYGSGSEIYLITYTKYINFSITIYPLDIEDLVYEQIFSTNNLGFVNFTKMYENFIEYEADSGNLILVCLMEYYTNNSAINDLNYFLYSQNEKTYLGNIINLKKADILEQSQSQIEISYPLHNYINDNSTVNKRNKDYLVENVKKMSLDYPSIDLSNISDPFYNDICFLFTTEVNTDMSLKDRREEYYVNISLCENNCSIITILNKDVKSPRALCNCNIKSFVIFNSKPGVNDDIPSISSYNGKAVSCISTVFNKNLISSNILFWIFIIVILFLISMILAFILFGKKEMKTIFKSYNNNQNIDNSSSNSKISISNNENEQSISRSSSKKTIKSEQSNKSNQSNQSNKNNKNNDINISENNNINKNDDSKNNSKNEKKKDLAKSMGIPDNKVKRYSNNEIESQQIEYLSAPINQPAPPKRKIQKVPSLMTKTENKTDGLISNSEPSFFKNSTIKPNEKDNNDISFENLPYENQIYIDILLKRRKMMENNYLKNPVEYERFQRMQIMKNSLYNLEDIERKKYCNSCEDIHNPSNTNINGNKKDKNINKKERNKLIIKLLDAESLFDNEVNNNNLSDNNDEKKLNNEKEKNRDNNTNNSLFKEEKGFEGNEQFFFPDGIFGKDGENLLIINDNDKNSTNMQKKGKNKNKKKTKFKEDNKNEGGNENESENNYKNESDNENNKHNKNNNKNKNNNTNKLKKNRLNDTSRNINSKNRLLKSIGKNDFYDDEDNKEDKDGDYENKNEKLKTEYDQDADNRIKSKLKKIASGQDSEGDIFNKYKNNNSLISDDNDFNKLKKSYNTNIIKMKSKSKRYITKENKHNKNNSSKEINSNRKMISFPEEGEFKGDMGVPINDSNLLKNRINNNEDKNTDLFSINKSRNKNDFEMFNKVLTSSVSAFLETEGKKLILVDEKFFLFYWRYFKKRELCLVCFIDKKDKIPYFIRWSAFVFCLIFIFLLNCLFFFEKNVHKRYINALDGNKNSIGYYFKNEFLISFFIALISIVFKMIIVKLVLYRLFKIKKEHKKMMIHSAEEGLNQMRLEELQNKRNKFLLLYKMKLILYFVLLMIFSILFAYICICYGGIFRNSISAFLYGFLFTCILTFIICALFCLIIVGIYRIAKYFKNRCLLSTFIVLSTMY